MKQASAWSAVKSLSTVCDEYSRIYIADDVKMPFKSPVMNEPLLWIVVTQNLVSAALLPWERKKKSSVQLAARAVGSRSHNPVPMTTRKRAGNKPFCSTLNCSLRLRRIPTCENTTSWRKGGQREVGGGPTYLPPTDSNRG